VTSALGHAAYAIRDRMERFERSAERVARSPRPDYVQETVEQMTAQHAVAANVAVIKTADAMVGTLFDIVA
jgi:flagellar basal body rod protein FlgC